MQKMRIRFWRMFAPVATLVIILVCAGPAQAWHDKTHLAIAQAAGYENWYDVAGPDIAKVKAGDVEAANHWFDNPQKKPVTVEMVLNQAMNYNNPNDRDGHLYGAIIATLRSYIAAKGAEKTAGYPMVFCAHYIGDLSMPLHNAPYDAYNEAHHADFDGAVEEVALDKVAYIKSRIYPIEIKCEDDVAREIARIANNARLLAEKLEASGATKLEPAQAYDQMVQSASLLKAVLKYASDAIAKRQSGCK